MLDYPFPNPSAQIKKKLVQYAVYIFFQEKKESDHVREVVIMRLEK